LPGFGKSQNPPEAWGVNNYADFVNHFLKKISISHVFAIAGHSNGGTIALYGLSRGSLKAKKLVLLASAGVRDQQRSRKRVIKVIARSGKTLTKVLPSSTQNKIKTKFYKSIGSEELLLPNLKETFRRVISEDVQDKAKTLDIPSLLIYGTADKATPLSYGILYTMNIQTKLRI
jgi:pimeloyl-ACP methyl ester carboxylesterase